MNQEYYQIYEDTHPLIDKSYQDLRAARVALKDLFTVLQDHGKSLGYTVQNRLSFIPIRNTLGIRITYADGTTIHRTYTIRCVRLRAIPAF